jgi:hypothetical protein
MSASTTRPVRSLRPYVAMDFGPAAEMLAREGIAPDAMAFARLQTFVLEEDLRVMGFVTLAIAHDVFPSVQHFVVAREYRTPARARFLVKALRRVIRDAGYPKFIVHAERAYLRRLIEWYFRATPYAFDDRRAFYLVTATGGIS